MVPYEATFFTGDIQDAGTDAQVFIKVFGVKGSSSDIQIEKMSERFERGRTDLIKVSIYRINLQYFKYLKHLVKRVPSSFEDQQRLCSLMSQLVEHRVIHVMF